MTYPKSVYKDKRATMEYWLNRADNAYEDLLTESGILNVNRLMRKKCETLTDMAKFPAKLSCDEVEEMILSAQQFFRNRETIGEYYDRNGSVIVKGDFKAAKENCNIGGLKNNVATRFALTLNRADLRLLPTEKYFFDTKDFRYYDDLQGTAVDPLEPLAVICESADGEFFFAVMKYYRGWINRDAVVFTDRSSWLKYVQPKNFFIAINNKSYISCKNERLAVQMGKLLPIVHKMDKNSIYLPKELRGKLATISKNSWQNDEFDTHIVEFATDMIILQAFCFIGDEYGWGGMNGGVDCSSFVMNVYRSMGIDLPRDADEQERALPVSLDLAGLSEAERYKQIRKAPIGALLFKPGHVMLYLGTDDKGEPAVIHALSSYFDFKNDIGEKHYVRKVVVSDLRLKNSQNVETINSLTSIGFFKKW